MDWLTTQRQKVGIAIMSWQLPQINKEKEGRSLLSYCSGATHARSERRQNIFHLEMFFFFRGPYSPPARIWQKPIIISTVNHMSSLQLEEETSSSHRTKMWFFECLYAFSTQCSHLLTKTPNEFSCRFLILFYFILFHCISFYCIVLYFILSCILSVAVDNSGNSHTV